MGCCCFLRKKPRDGDTERGDNYTTIGAPPPVPSSSQLPEVRVIVRGMYDFQGLQNDDLSFRKGDLMDVLDDDMERDWLKARHKKTGNLGYVPANYVVIVSNTPESQEWFFRYDRAEADRHLHTAENRSGTFLVRPRADNKSYALSILDRSAATTRTVKHYMIKLMDNGEGCFITAKRTFPNMMKLIDHYKKYADGLCVPLTDVCPRQAEAVPFRDIEVERNEIKLGDQLGSGQFGDVFKGKFRNVLDVAIKTFKEGRMTPDAFLDEARIMHALRHRKLVQLMGVCTTPPMYIITELMVHGALLDYLKSDKSRDLHLGYLIDMASQIADGMAYLEAKKYIHRDLRAANILVGDHNVVKVADFGLARLVPESCVYGGSEGTKFPIKWTAPEAALRGIFSTKSDVWSYGILLYEIITFGRVPYPGMSATEVLEQTEKGYRMPRPRTDRIDCPVEYYHQMLSCWHKNPQDRPTFDALKSLFEDFSSSCEGQYREPT